MEKPIYTQAEKESLYGLAQVFHEIIHGKTIEDRLNETTAAEKLQEKLDSAYNLLKAGVAAQIAALSLKLPMEKVLEIQATLKLNQA